MIWTRPDYALKCGDFVRVTITSEPYDGQYDMRILNKALQSSLNADVMELTLSCWGTGVEKTPDFRQGMHRSPVMITFAAH